MASLYNLNYQKDSTYQKVSFDMAKNVIAQEKNVQGDCFQAECPARLVLSHVSSRWGSLILAALHAQGTMRFSELRKRIDGVSEKMLSQKLRELERDGLLHRKSYDVVPPHVDYHLTEMGAEIAEHIQALVGRINYHAARFMKAHDRYDSEK